MVLVLVKLEVEDDLGDETEVDVAVDKEVGLTLVELDELEVVEATAVDGVMVAVMVCNIVVVETRAVVNVDAAIDEEEAIEEAKSEDDDANAPVGLKLNVEAGGWPVMLTPVCVCPECVDQSKAMARLAAT